jgi:translation initiation factor 5A
MSDDEFGGGSGASLVVPMQCSSIRKGGFALMRGHPCKVVDMSTSKTGKHGHAKVHMVGLDIFTGKKYEEICPSTHNMDIPVVKRTDYQLMDITEEGYCSLLTDAGDPKEDLKVPEGELGEKLQADFDADKDLNVTVIAAMDMVRWRSAPPSLSLSLSCVASSVGVKSCCLRLNLCGCGPCCRACVCGEVVRVARCRR